MEQRQVRREALMHAWYFKRVAAIYCGVYGMALQNCGQSLLVRENRYVRVSLMTPAHAHVQLYENIPQKTAPAPAAAFVA